jgi:uncharacterized membrane protein
MTFRHRLAVIPSVALLAASGCALERADRNEADGETESRSSALTAVDRATAPKASIEALAGLPGRKCQHAGVTISLPDGDETTEAGGHIRIRLVLTSRPTGPVVVALASSDRSEGIARGAAHFTPGNWDSPQDVLVTGQPDDVVDGDRPYDVRVAVTSVDPWYRGLKVPPVRLINKDDDTVGLLVSPRGSCTTDEHGGQATLDVALRSKPTRPVRVTAVVSNALEATVISAPLVFGPWNWSRPQATTLQGASDMLADGTVPYDVVLNVESADPAYAELPPPHIGCQNRDRAGFAGLGDLPDGDFASAALDVNANGTVVVGYGSAADGRQAVRWTPTTGLVSLGGDTSMARGVDDSGDIIVGEAKTDFLNRGRILTAAVWSQGSEPSFPDFYSPGDQSYMRALGVSGDGGTIVGQGFQQGNAGVGIVWRLGMIDFSRWGNLALTAASLDGSIIVGYTTWSYLSNTPIAVRNDVWLAFPSECSQMKPVTCATKALDVSADGTRTVGWVQRAGASEQPAAWDAASPDAVTLLPARETGEALSISADGNVIVGYENPAGEPTAIRWSRGVSRTVVDLLNASGVVVAGWQLTYAHGTSQDGRVIVGEGINPSGQPEGWIAVLPGDDQ